MAPESPAAFARRFVQAMDNFAGIVIRLTDDGKVAEYRIVEALPAESDRFWSA
jgi:hypothetical protein